MKRALYILLFLLITANIAVGQTYTAEMEFHQYTGWSISLGPNITSYRINMQNSTDAPDKVTPAFGIDGGAAMEYHISPEWSIQTGAMGSIERIGLRKDDGKTTLTTFGIDLALQACWRNGKKLMLAVGPYTHFVFGSITANSTIPNPYRRGFADDPRTNEPLFALGDLNAGLALTAGYKMTDNWQIVFDFKWGVTDMLNTDSHSMYVRPFKIGLRVEFCFD